MIEGIRLCAQLRSVWEQVSPALGKNLISSCFAKNPDIQFFFKGLKKILIFIENIYLLTIFYRETSFLDVLHFHSILVFKLYFFETPSHMIYDGV